MRTEWDDIKQIGRELVTSWGGVGIMALIALAMMFAKANSPYATKPPVFEDVVTVTVQSPPIDRRREYKSEGDQRDLYATYPYFFRAEDYWGKGIWVNTPAAIGLNTGQSVKVDRYRCDNYDGCMVHQYLPKKHGPAQD